MSWPLVELASLEGQKGDLVDGPFGSNLKAAEYVESGVPIIQLKNIKPNAYIAKDLRYISPKKAGELSRHSYRPGDVVIAKLGAVGTACIIPEDSPAGVIVADVVRFRGRSDRIDHRYLCYFMNSSTGQRAVAKLSRGTTRVRTNLSDLKKVEIPLPPLPEQKRIAAILDRADAIQRKRQQAIQLADDFLRAVFLDMFGDPVTNLKGWEVKPVGDLCDCIVPGRDKPKSFNGPTPWITTNELIHLGITFKKENFIGLSADEISEVRAKVVPRSSVIMTCVGDLGVVSVAGEDMIINQQLHAFLPNEKISPVFLSYALAWQKGYMLKMASSTTLPYMNKAVCNSVPVILPPKVMQKKFEDVVLKTTLFKSKSIGFSDETVFASISHKAFSGQL
ncbi:restriction endonuclease subunit S [Halopseudomonas sp.]|uniref:restriction endonuclease subunit S n=1 Tax=Halopseudomonas sp. TaxID=2901191 RepID=UPI0030030D46